VVCEVEEGVGGGGGFNAACGVGFGRGGGGGRGGGIMYAVPLYHPFCACEVSFLSSYLYTGAYLEQKLDD